MLGMSWSLDPPNDCLPRHRKSLFCSFLHKIGSSNGSCLSPLSLTTIEKTPSPLKGSYIYAPLFVVKGIFPMAGNETL